MKILVGTAHGLAYLHEGCQTRIVHRDIKSSNILLDKDLTAKIADFGLARLMSEDRSYVSTRFAGTFGYWSPEYAMRGHLSEKADVFSYGIVALELVSGRNTFNDKLPTEQAFLLNWTWTLHENGNLMDILDPVLVEAQPEEVTRVIELALLCTQAVPSVRPSMTKVASVLLGQCQVETRNLEKPSFLSESSTMSRPQASTSEPKSDFRNDAPAITVVTAR
ncbi:hypothetical protein M758_12G128500 [Ceratodon purpureus]|nr:hypothetical protein KC19_12G126100 [Ceratodon purpureus]KAG0599107.1 hypothetical protein M758_12G128500 [Ceratodon purpureus]